MQPQVQQFLNVISNVQNTPPQHMHDALTHIRKFYADISDQQTYNFVLFKVAEHILKLKSINQQNTWLLQQCITDIIFRCLDSQFNIGLQVLRCIFDLNFDYYKHSNIDTSLKYPLGLHRPLQWYEPQVGQTVDVVKPHITSTSFCCWTRGILLSKDNKKYTVKYANTETPVTNSTLPWFDVVGNRTKDYDWRNSLNVGDHIDAYNKFWYPSTVVESAIQNGAKRVRVTFRRFNQNGQKIDSQGNRYDGLGTNEDDWMDIFSYRIQRPNKMSHELCYYSHSSEQMILDDTYDLLFEKQYEEKPFWGIMRSNFVRSLSFLHFFNYFCENNGYEIFIRKVKNKQLNIDSFTCLLLIFGNTAFLVPRMAIKLYLPTILHICIEYIKQNNKLLNPYRLDIFSFFFQNTAKRIYSLSRKHIILNNIRKYLSLQYLKLNLQKQMIALRFLVELIRPLRPYQTDAEKKQLESFLIENQIFYKIIQNNAHQQILSRSVDLLKFMITNNIIGWNEIQYIWNIVPNSDLRGRATVEKLIGDISKDFSLQYTSRIIDKLIAVKQTEITIDKLNLLRTLKDKALKMDTKVKILNYLWECLTVKSINIKQNVEQYIENVFRGFISTIKESSLKLQVLKAILRRLKEINTVHNEMHLFKQFLLTYPAKVEDNSLEIEGDLPQIISQVIIYLKNQSIYECLLKLLGQVKTKQKIESILQFIFFLFEKDKDDISSIVKSIYELLGPSDEFLLWAKNLTSRALKFFIELYEDTTNMQKFEKISINGLQAIKTILLDINVYEGNIKILKKRKAVMIGPAPAPVSSSVGTSTSQYPNKSSTDQQTQNYSQRKVDNKQKSDKQQTLTFVYVLKSPFECKGLAFLLQLLQYIKNNRVYADIIKLIIQFIVNLDEKIIDKTQIFREEFLSRIIGDISVIAKNNQLNDAIKLRLQIFVNLIEQLFSETEKEGLGCIRPHFSTIEGQIINLKIQNMIATNQINKKQPYCIEVNQNMTLWDLKVNLAAIYKESPLLLDIIKYVNPLEDTLNSKSMQQLHFFNEEAIKIQKKSPKDIPRHDLLTPDNENLSEKFNQIVEKWFKTYQNEIGYLSIVELTKLGTDQWKGSIFKQQNKLLQIINKYDQDKKGGLYLNEFKAFFIKKSIENNSAIWRVINLSGYRNNLKHKDEPQTEFDQKALPRRILSNKIVYDTIFTILSSDVFQTIHLNFYKLLTMLQTDHDLSTIVKSNIRQFLQNQKCIYRLSYGLQSLINELQNNLQLYGEFYQHDGHVQIASKLQNYFKEETTSIYSLDVLSKTVVIPNLLKILNLYVYPLISDHGTVRLIKKTKINHYDLEELAKKIQKQQNYASEQLEYRQVLLSKKKTINLSETFALAYRILQNEIVNFKTDYLIKVTFEVSRLFASLAQVQPSFRPQSIINGLKSQSVNLRRICQSTIFLYLMKNKSPEFELLDKMIEQMPKEIKFASSNHYFMLLLAVLQKSIQVTKNTPQCDDYYKTLALKIISIIWKTPNQIRGQNTVNKLLNGLFGIFYYIITKKPQICKQLQYLKQELITKCLFFYNPQQKISKTQITPQLLLSPTQPQLFSDYVKCKSDQTRKIVMDIVYQLYKESDEDHSNFFEVFILPILRELPENTKKTSSKYLSVGLNNLGSTCYMNSMLQVLNSIDPFRNAIMMANVDTPLIRELKSLFSYLFFSERLDYVPKQLLSSFIPPINPGIQQDTTQFLNFLFDQIEQSLKSSPYRTLLQEIFKGNQVAQMICHSCGAKRQRQEQFFTYSVQIQGKYDLHSALQGMHTGQLITDCLCESCGNRSDTTKRNVLNEVPNIFFVHLKRIVFNYDVFVNTKIHTRLYFPDELNFEPYTKEGVQLRQSLGVEYMKLLKDNEQQMKKFQILALHGKQKKYYQLKLKGIIIHSGTPDVGHYYTIIKRDSNWIKYDDSRASLFSSMSFDEECYGGSWVADEWGGFGSSKNAYVLVYEKEYKKDIAVEYVLDDQSVVRRPVPYSEFKTYNTQDWYKQVWLDNHSLMIEQHLTGQNFTKDFLGFVNRMLELTPSVSTIEIISQIFYKISALSGEVGNLLQIFNKNTFLINEDILKKYILADPKKTFNLLFHYQPKVRQFASEYIHQILISTYTDGSFQIRQQIFKFINEYLQILNGQAAKNWLRIDGYFKLFEKLVQSSVNYAEMYQYFLNTDLITYFIDFILQKSSPLNFIPKKYSIGTKSTPVNFSSALNIIFFLFRKSYGLIGRNFQIPEVSQNLLFHLSDNAITCLTCTSFYQKMIKQNQNREVLSQLMQRMCVMNLDFSLTISRTLLKCLNQNTEPNDELQTIMLCITKVLTIKDQFWQLRAEAILGTSSPYIYQTNLISSIDQEKYIYPSTLENLFPLQSLLSYAHISRTRIPLTALNMIKTILQSCSVTEQAMQYLLKQPSPSYIHLRYVDWLRPYVNEVINLLNLKDKKLQQTLNKISVCNLYLDDLDKVKNQMNVIVAGQVQDKVLVKPFTDPSAKVQINFYNVPVNGIESLPNGQSNVPFQKYLTNGRLQTQVTPNSNILKYFKQNNKPLAIKPKSIEEDQDKQLIGLFDQNPYPTVSTATPMDIEIPQSAKPQQLPHVQQTSVKQQPSVTKIQQQPVQLKEIQIQGARVYPDYLRCLQIINKSQSSQLVLISLDQRKSPNPSNSTLPQLLRIVVSKSKEDYWYSKVNPLLDWNQLNNLTIVVQDYVETQKKIITRLYPLPVQLQYPQYNHHDSDPQKQNESANHQQPPSNTQEPANDFPEDFNEAEMNCPQCTLLNPISNSNCDVCGEPLHQN